LEELSWIGPSTGEYLAKLEDLLDLYQRPKRARGDWAWPNAPTTCWTRYSPLFLLNQIRPTLNQIVAALASTFAEAKHPC
jgi:hypothetical protein